MFRLAVYGWYQWRRGGDEHAGVQMQSLGWSQHGIIILAILVITLVSGFLLGLSAVYLGRVLPLRLQLRKARSALAKKENSDLSLPDD